MNEGLEIHRAVKNEDNVVGDLLIGSNSGSQETGKVSLEWNRKVSEKPREGKKGPPKFCFVLSCYTSFFTFHICSLVCTCLSDTYDWARICNINTC